MTNLAGNDMQAVLDAFEGVDDDTPTCFIAYTIKGQGLPFAGHKDNHSGLMTLDQMAGFKKGMGIADGQEWDKFAGLAVAAGRARRHSSTDAPFNAEGRRRTEAPAVADSRRAAAGPTDRESSTQEGFGKILNAIAARGQRAGRAHRHDLARRHGLDQSRRLGQPARPVRPHRGRGRVPRARRSCRPSCGARRRAASISSSASPRTTCSSSSPRSASATSCSARGCCRSARSTIRSSPAASMR